MKPLFLGLYGLFLCAMGMGFYFAYQKAEGLVDSGYYEKASGYFTAKAAEDSLGLVITPPAALKRGENRVSVSLKSSGRPLEKATTRLFIGNVSRTGFDSRYLMRESAPGIYTTTAELPCKGTWLVRLELETPTLKTSKRWFMAID
jgi:hypothetical protein